LSTPTEEQYKCENLADRGIGYGMESHIIDGNNILEVYATVDKLCKKIRKNPAPILLEFKTFRMRGHEEASGTKYVPQDLMDAWAKKDPIANYEQFLIDEKVLDADKVESIRKGIEEEINKNLKLAFDENAVTLDKSKELNDVYKTYDYEHFKEGSVINNIRLVDAISNGLKESMKKHDNLVIMGQDIADYGWDFQSMA